MPRRRGLEPHFIVLALAAWLTVPGVRAADDESVTFRLKNGDRISGVIVSETTNQVVISNRWAPQLSIPLAEVAQREKPVGAAGSKSTDATAPKTTVKLSPPKETPPKFDNWKGELRVGLDVLEGRRDRQIYHGKAKLDYQRPYLTGTNRLFRNALEYTVEYGTTDGEKSSDKMDARDKMIFDLTPRWYHYSLSSFGYDRIRKIEYQLEAGTGFGRHLVARTNLQFNAEAGMSYQAYYRIDTEPIADFYYRFAEDFAWKMRTRTTLTEKFEFTPRVNLRDYRFRFETTISHDLWRYVSLNFSILDLYDTQPAPEVDRNELQIRSSIGLKF